jgi:hypothetical protein
MRVKLVSTKVGVRDRRKVQEILDAYGTRGVEVVLAEEGGRPTLAMAFEENDADWAYPPEALPRDRWPTAEQYPDEEDRDEALDELYLDKGPEGFRVLLRALAPHLEGPLLVLMASWDRKRASAQVWGVCPGAAEVEALAVSV